MRKLSWLLFQRPFCIFFPRFFLFGGTRQCDITDYSVESGRRPPDVICDGWYNIFTSDNHFFFTQKSSHLLHWMQREPYKTPVRVHLFRIQLREFKSFSCKIHVRLRNWHFSVYIHQLYQIETQSCSGFCRHNYVDNEDNVATVEEKLARLTFCTICSSHYRVRCWGKQ